MSDISKSGAHLPSGLDVSLTARLQLELIGTLIKAGNRKQLRKIVLASSGTGKKGQGLGSLSKEELRTMFKMRMNIEPVEEVLDAFVGGRERVTAEDLMAAISADIQSRDLEAPFGNNDITVPYGTVEDAANCIEETQSRMDTKWGHLGEAFQRVSQGSNMVDYSQFYEALHLADRKYVQIDEEVERVFAAADAQGYGRVNWRNFMRELGLGTQSMPEFMKPRYLQGSIQGRIWQWHSYEQGSNAHRKFEVTDKAGLTRYHCKACHSYYLAKAFSEEAIRGKIHTCDGCMEALRIGCLPGKHTQRDPPEMWPRMDQAELKWRESLGNRTTYEVQQVRNLMPRKCTQAPWAEHPGADLVSQYNRNNGFI